MTALARHLLLTLFVVVSTAGPALAQWPTGTDPNLPVVVASGTQSSTVMVSDGRGGTIVAWIDFRAGHYDIYAQRLDRDGVPRWASNGVLVTGAAGQQVVPVMVGDGAGGAVIAWQDTRTDGFYDLYAQRIDSNGVPLWTANGVPVCTLALGQIQPAMISDGSGGAIVAWADLRSGVDYKVYAQRINGAGTPTWTANGVLLSTGANSQLNPSIGPDGSGGTIIAWDDLRGGIAYDIYAQRVSSAGALLWAAAGIDVVTAAESQVAPLVTSDGLGGAIVVWTDSRAGNNDIYCQRLDGAGAKKWLPSSGVAVCSQTDNQNSVEVTGDGAGGVVVVWSDNRNGPNYDIYAQRIGQAGVPAWTANGVPVCTAAGVQETPKIVDDGFGGTVVAWGDPRISSGNKDIYAQKLTGSGTIRFEAGGRQITSNGYTQSNPVLIADGKGGVVMAWSDSRNSSTDIYAQNLDRFGYAGVNAPGLTDVLDVAGDQGGRLTLAWDRAALDQYPHQTITHYSIWRGIDLPANPAGTVFVEPGVVGQGHEGPALRRAAGGSTGWELVGTMEAHYFPTYSYTAATTSDSTASGLPWFRFLVSAHTADPFVFWDSDADSGYSVDNLAPAAAVSVGAAAIAGPAVRVHWKRNTADPDVSRYDVHRSASSGFTPGPSTFLSSTPDTSLIDHSPAVGSPNYYRVVTVDVHDNRSEPSAEASASPGATLLYAVQDKWNMVSVPLTLEDYAKTAVYPGAVSSAFAYSDGYYAEATLANGKGYWVKFDGAQSVSMTGVLRDRDTIVVAEGWNLVGSISAPVAVGSITAEPAGMTTSPFYGYANGYSTSATIEPGKAYWVKTDRPGALILASGGAEGTPAAGRSGTAERIRIVPDAELPPAPPGDHHGLSSGAPGEYALRQNFPNPFNPSTGIRYDLPEGGRVKVAVYNAVGQEVARLVDTDMPAGTHTALFDASELPSGVYLARLSAGPRQLVIRMLLLR